MKKLLAIVLTAAMLLAMLCACAAKPTETAATDTKATIGILMPTKEQTIWSIQGERLTEAFQATPRRSNTQKMIPPSRPCRSKT